MTRKTIFEWAELFQEYVSNGASQSDIVQMLEDYKKEQLTIPNVVKSLPCKKCKDNGGFATMDGWENCTNCL
jgi:RNase P subunit RPR2